MARLFQNGEIASSASTELVRADVLIGDDGRIERVASAIEAEEGVETVDCSGCVLVPGMFDLNVHAREPGAEHKETIASCAAAALNGGVTGLVLMPDTSPVIDSGHLVRSVQDLVAQDSPIPMLVSGCLTRKREGEQLAAYSGMVGRGVAMLTDSERSVPGADVLRRCMEYAKDFGVLVATSADTPALRKAGAINEGRVSYRLGLPGIPSIAHEIAVDRDIRLAQFTGARLHLQQVGTANAVRAVAAAKQIGTSVTCEVSPHHLLLSDEHIIDYDTAFKLAPPLARPEDREALVTGLLDGTIDAIATNHAPHTEFEKACEFGNAPFGASGLDTAVVALYDGFVKPGVFGWDLLVRKYSDAPRRIVGLDPVAIVEGGRAEFFVFDPSAETRVSTSTMRTKSPVTPFFGRTFAGQVRETVIG